MSAEGMPPAEPSILARPLGWITRQVVRFPIPILAMAVTAALFSLVIAGGRLGFRTSRLDLLNPECCHNRLWVDYINEFGDQDDAVVVVEGAGRDQVVPVLDEISSELLQNDQYFHAVLHEVNLSKIRGKGLYYLPPAELREVETFLDTVEPIIQGQWVRLKLGNQAGGMCKRLETDRTGQTQVRLEQLTASLRATLNHEGRYLSPWPEMPSSVATLSELGSKYFLTNEGRLGFVLLRLTEDKKSFSHGTKAINELRQLIARVGARHPETTIGLTGLPVMENDEMRSSQSAMLKASLLSLFGVGCLFVAGLGGLRHPLMTVTTLLLAMAWSFGYITLAIGHLNILSIAFAVILIGLGIDFGIHYVARYLQIRGTISDSDEALVQTASSVGPGIITGTLTTAIAFFVAGFTEFTGVAELGVIAGGGILLCCLATMIVLPAMIHLGDENRRNQTLPVPLDIHGWMKPLFARPLLVLVVSLVGTAVVTLGMGRLWYDHNLLNLQPEGLESVELERKLLAESDQSVWFALSIAESPRELLARRDRFLKLPSVERVEEIASLVPFDHEEKRPIIERIRRRLADLPERPQVIPVDSPEDLGWILRRAQNALVDGSLRGEQLRRQLELVREDLRNLPERKCIQRLSEFQHYMASDLLSRLHKLRAMSNPEPPRLDDLPEGLVTRFVGRQDRRYLMKIYSKADIWDMDAMREFVREVRGVDPRATGNPLQTYEASRQMKRSYENAAWYALAAILVVLYLDFRSLRYTFLAMLPMGLGMLQMFGLLGYLNIPLNPANMIVLPLILGIGIDDGVHVVHDFRLRRGRYRMSASTASAVLITSLTTMIGFGSLMIASHKGLQSLGRVLTIGVSCCLFTSLVMLPALLGWLTRNRPEETEPEGPLPPADTSAPRHIRHRRDPAHHPGTSRHAAGGSRHAEQLDANRP